MKRLAGFALLMVLLLASGPVRAAETWYELKAQGDQLSFDGDTAGAIAFYEKGIEAAGDNTLAKLKLLWSLSYVQRYAGRLEDARGTAEAGLALSPHNTDFILSLAQWHLKWGSLDEAIRLYERALDIKEDGQQQHTLEYASILDSLSVAHQRAGAVRKALDLSEQAADTAVYYRLNLSPTAARIVTRQAGYFVALGRWEEALDVALPVHSLLFQREGEYDWLDAHVDTMLAQTLLKLGLADPAAEALRRAVSFADFLDEGLWRDVPSTQVRVLNALGTRDAADQALDGLVSRVFATRSDEDRIALIRAEHAALRGRPQTALEILERRLALDPMDRGQASDDLERARLLSLAGTIYAALGNFDTASAFAQQAEDLVPEAFAANLAPELRSVETRVALGVGDIRAARKHVRALARLTRDYPTGGATHGDVALIEALVWLHRGRDGRADEALEEARAAYGETAAGDLYLARAETVFAQELVRLDRAPDRAEALLRGAMAAYETRFGAEASELIQPLSVLAKLLRDQGRAADAEAVEARERALRAKYGEDEGLR